VLVNCCTTGGLEALLNGVPVVCLRGAIYPTEGSDDPLEAKGTVPAQSGADLEPVVERLLNDRGFRDAVAADAETLLASVLGDPEGAPPIDRLAAECERTALPPPAARHPAALGHEVHARLAEARRLLLSGRPRQEFVASWKQFARSWGEAVRPRRSAVRRVLYTVSWDIGLTAASAGELLELVRDCFEAARDGLRLSGRVGRAMAANALLSAAARHSAAGDWRQALAYVRHLLGEAPRAAARLPGLAELLQALEAELDRLGRAAAAPRGDAAAHELGPSPQARADALEAVCRFYRERAHSLQGDLEAVRRSWTWKLGRLLVGPPSRLMRALRPSDPAGRGRAPGDAPRGVGIS
jgi:hypothetical protein